MSKVNLVLFNCCAGFAEPNWSDFKSLELAGAYNDGPVNADEETSMIGGLGVDDPKAVIFTIYGRDAEGLANAITDFSSLSDAVAGLRVLAAASGLPVRIARDDQRPASRTYHFSLAREIAINAWGQDIILPKGTELVEVIDGRGLSTYAVKDANMLARITGNHHDPMYRYLTVPLGDVSVL